MITLPYPRAILALMFGLCLALPGVAQDTLRDTPTVSREEERLIDKIFRLPEVKRRNDFIDSFSHHTHGIAIMVLERPKKSNGYYYVQAGYNGPERFEPYFTFYVYRPGLMIKVYDPMNDALYSLEEWRRRRGKTYN